MKKKYLNTKQDSKDGFTLIEVMLTLAITGLMLVGIIGGSYTSIARQRYNDALNSFAEYLSRVYSETLSPESLGQGNSDTNPSPNYGDNFAILGKVLVFGHDYADNEEDSRSVFSATLVGDATVSHSSGQGFLEELATLAGETNPITGKPKLQLFCGNESRSLPSTVAKYTPLWQTKLMSSVNAENPNSQPFRGTIIIARTPTSGSIHTAFAQEQEGRYVYDLRDRCTPDDNGASTNFIEDLRGHRADYSLGTSGAEKVGICLDSDDSPVTRQVDILLNGSNASAVSILSEGESQCR